MNIITDLTNRIEEYRTTNKNPCKNYATESAAEKATAKAAQNFGNRLDREGKSARYVVFYVEAWGRWVGAIDAGEVYHRSTFMSGYVGPEEGFYSF